MIEYEITDKGFLIKVDGVIITNQYHDPEGNPNESIPLENRETMALQFIEDMQLEVENVE